MCELFVCTQEANHSKQLNWPSMEPEDTCIEHAHVGNTVISKSDVYSYCNAYTVQSRWNENPSVGQNFCTMALFVPLQTENALPFVDF